MHPRPESRPKYPPLTASTLPKTVEPAASEVEGKIALVWRGPEARAGSEPGAEQATLESLKEGSILMDIVA